MKAYVYKLRLKGEGKDFPAGPVVKDPPASAGDTGSIRGQGTKIPHASGQLSPRVLQVLRLTLQSPSSATREQPPLDTPRGGPHPVLQRRPSTAKIN